MTRLRTQEIALQQLGARIRDMKGEERPFLLTNFDILCSLDDADFKGVMNVYTGLLKINGMSELTAFSTIIQIAHKAARM